MMPMITADLRALRHNAEFIQSQAEKHGVQVAAVTKVFCAAPGIVNALIDFGFSMLADARVLNLSRLPDSVPRLSLRVSAPQEAEDVVKYSEYSLQSTREAVHALGQAARKLNKPHKVILMIDLGDLREGIYHTNTKGIDEMARAVLGEEGLVLEGVGANLTCFGGILPDQKNLRALLDIAENLRRGFGIPLPLVSGGNSSSLHLLFEGRLPKGVNHLRVGEGLLLGMDTASGTPFPQLSQAVFTQRAVLVEAETKPSRPEGSTGPNAFGETVRFEDQGPMRRGILALGRQDTDPERLTPRDSRVSVIGASSDHLLVDLKDGPYRVGDALAFTPGYGALLKAYTSAYVSKSIIDLEGKTHEE